MRALLVAAILALPLVPTSTAAAPDASVCGFTVDLPSDPTDVCLRADLLTPAGPSHLRVNATLRCSNSPQSPMYVASTGYDARAPLGNPGLLSGWHGSHLAMPYVCEL